MHATVIRRRGVTRQGLTLMELVVVMVVLVALATILVSRMAGVVTQAHTSTSATNISEISKAIQLYEAQHLGYPSGLDSLVTNLSSGTLASYIAGGGTDLTTVALDNGSSTGGAGTLGALRSAGIASVTPMVENPGPQTPAWSPTFFPYIAAALAAGVPAPVALTDGNVLAGLNGIAAAREFNAPSTAQYVLLGVGPYSKLSRVMQEAPVHFNDSPDGAPTLAYARYVVVFQVTDGAGQSLDRALLVGVVGIHDDQVAGLGDHMQEYFNTTKN